MDLSHAVKRWATGYGNANWESTIREILTANSYVVTDTTIQTVRDHFRLCKSFCLCICILYIQNLSGIQSAHC